MRGTDRPLLGRLWQLSFLVARRNDHKRLSNVHVTPGRLAVKLALLPHSPPTRLNCTLVIKERVEQRPALPVPSFDQPSGSEHFEPPISELLEAPIAGPSVNPPIEVRLTAERQLVPGSGLHDHRGMIAVSLEDNDRANTLQVE